MQRLLFDLLPVIAFFIIYKFFGIYAATASAIAISVVQAIYIWFKHQRIDAMQISALVLIIIFGGATLISHDAMFIKWKVSVLYWLFAVVILGSHFIGHKPIVERIMDSQIDLPEKIWRRLSTSWIIFFLLVGFLNLYLIYHVSTDTWVNFKLFGILGLTLVFFVGQGFYLMRHVKK